MDEYQLEQLESLEQLVKLFEKRDEEYDVSTEGILDVIHDPLLVVVAELFNSSANDITWTAVDINLPMLVLTCNIEYTDVAAIPQFVNVVAPPSADENSMIRKITVGLPIVMVFAEKERIKQYLETTIEKTLERVNTKAVTTPAPAQLTPEQSMQLFMYRKQNKGSIH